MEENQGHLFILSGPSGAGKSTVIREVLRRNPSLYFSVSYTTRPPRPEERDGAQYSFVSREEFEGMIARDEFLEYIEYVGNYYGTSRPRIESYLKAGTDVLLDIEVRGAALVRAKFQNAVSIFFLPPSFGELERRLRGRNTDHEEKIAGRLKTAREEYQKARSYDYIVVNGDVDTAAREVEAILTAERCRTANRLYLIKEE